MKMRLEVGRGLLGFFDELFFVGELFIIFMKIYDLVLIFY